MRMGGCTTCSANGLSQEEDLKSRQPTVVKAKEWSKPRTPTIVRTAKQLTRPLSPNFLTDQRANSKRGAAGSSATGFSTPTPAVL